VSSSSGPDSPRRGMLGPEDEGPTSKRPLLYTSGHSVTLRKTQTVNFMETAHHAEGLISGHDTGSCNISEYPKAQCFMPSLYAASLSHFTYIT
jgi:hypothetical protein